MDVDGFRATSKHACRASLGGTVSVLVGIPLLLTVSACGGSKSDPTQHTEKPAPVNALPSAGVDAIPGEHLDHIVELFNRGIGLMDQYQASKAVSAFQEVVQLAPHWTTGRLNLGIALLNVQTDDSYARAEEELKRVITAEPENCRAHYGLGMLLRHLTRFDEAQSQFEKVLEVDPHDPDAHYQLGMLIADKDPAAARRHLEETLKWIPHHESACYRLQSLLRQAGETQQAHEILTRFQALKADGAGITFGMKYGEMGRYAEVIRALEGGAPDGKSTVMPTLADVAEQEGLVHVAGGSAGWPGTRGAGADFGPGLTSADVDGDGDLDIYIPGVDSRERGILYRNEQGHFSVATRTGIDGRDAIGAYFGDYDGDGDPDLYLTCSGPNRLYKNEGEGQFIDVTQASGTAGGDYLSLGAAWADADHDGDLDLYVANYASTSSEVKGSNGAPNALWRNNGDGTFTDVAVETGIDGGAAATVGVVFFDADDDRDVDLYLINNNARNRLFLNQRVGAYEEATSRYSALADDGPGLGAVLGDVDLNGREDLLLIRGHAPPRLYLQVERGRFVEDSAFGAFALKLGGAVGGLMGDLDLDGDLDILLLCAGREQETGHQILMNQGNGRFEPPVAFGPQQRTPDCRGAIAVDVDGDGTLEVVVARAGARPELWRAAQSAGPNWLEVIPSLSRQDKVQWTEPSAVGLSVEIKTGLRLQVASIASSSGYLGGPPPRAHFGLGQHGRVDYVRLTWPDAVLQSELEVAAGQRWHITKVRRKPSSCPILFSWDGQRFAFVTDFLGGGGLGFFVRPGAYAPPDPTEDVRIPPSRIKPHQGRYLLRVAEPLEEATYLDQLYLLAFDHPADWELYPDERFTGASSGPTGRPFAVAEKIYPRAARTDRDPDVLDRLLNIDRRYVEPPSDARWKGYAKDHWIELDFGDQLQNVKPAQRLVLYLYGWVEYTYSHVNYAAWQAGVSMRSPRIEVPDGNGGWKVALPDAGFPAGLPRMMTLDISSLPISRDARVRIHTNMEIFWDQIFVGTDVAGPQIRMHRLAPSWAQLRQLGYPQQYSPDGNDPTIYDYYRLEQGVAFKHLSGAFTQFGDVRGLLERVDDQFVIMGRGEEIALEFDATQLPRVPPGWARTLVLHTDGYCKDMDLYTAFPDTLSPLPYHGMGNYPPTKPRREPVESQPIHRQWNTRHIRGR